MELKRYKDATRWCDDGLMVRSSFSLFPSRCQRFDWVVYTPNLRPLAMSGGITMVYRNFPWTFQNQFRKNKRTKPRRLPPERSLSLTIQRALGHVNILFSSSLRLLSIVAFHISVKSQRTKALGISRQSRKTLCRCQIFSYLFRFRCLQRNEQTKQWRRIPLS